MTTDDLRTRAREAAEERYAKVDQPQFRLAFIAGYLARAAQRPSREQIARAIAESQNPGVPGAFDAQRGAWLTDADAVLALFDGADQ